jgi:ribosomal protein S18 acetylase RimI-like enzyme
MNQVESVMTQVTYKPAEKKDCRTIAALYSMSSDGVADYIWTTLADPGENILEVGRRRYEREDTPFSYQSCTLALVDDEIAGMMVAFPMWVDGDTEPETDPVLAPYSRLEEDASYYVCGVAVFEQYRGLGIGRELMLRAERDARERDLEKLSLIVFEQNSGPKVLYERLGYVETGRAEVVPHPLIHRRGDALLMVKYLDR